MTTDTEPGRPRLAYVQAYRPGARGTRFRLPLVAFGALMALSVLLRLTSASPLWLDEALSVNIADLPAGQLFSALRQDGSPPLYYLTLHAWISVFGTADDAVRALSTAFALATLPVIYRLGYRLHGPTAARMSAVLFGICPFAVRYSTETRMYSLLFLLTAAFLLQLLNAWRAPERHRLAGLAVLSGLLALTHYWALFFLGACGALLLVLSVRGGAQRQARRCTAGVLAGAVIFLPWFPSFLYQIKHTGTPWANPPGAGAVVDTARQWAGGSSWPATISLWLGVLLALWACVPVFYRRPTIALQLETQGDTIGVERSRPSGILVAASLLTLVLGLAASQLQGSGYAFRYSSVALVPALSLVALGLALVPRRLRYAALSVLLVAGLATSVRLPFNTTRTQAASTAAAIKAGAGPNDLVVYCPDQLGPAVNRLLPSSLDQVVYPTLASPKRVDWVDYAQRNAAANPSTIAAQIEARSTGGIWLVMRVGYLTFGQQCQQLASLLWAQRGGYTIVAEAEGKYAESESLVYFPPDLNH